MTEIGAEFKPGDRIPNSGIYEVVHEGHHRPNHQVMCSCMKTFPGCRACGSEVRFRLAINVPDISEDMDFS